MNSVPIAHTWEPVARAAAGGLFLSAYAEERVEGSETDSIWGSLAEKVPVTDAFSGEPVSRACSSTSPSLHVDLFSFVALEVDELIDLQRG